MTTTTTATATVHVPIDSAAYGRWLAGKMAGYAALIGRDERADLDDAERQYLADAARTLLAALDH